MRLIDADALVKFLKGCTMSNGTLINTNTMLEVVEKMPTAYDISKVVAELENMKLIRVEQCHDDYEIEVMTNNNFDDAIDIVKRGGVE